MAVVTAIGVIDDVHDISYKVRMLAHASVVVGIFLTEGLLVNNIGAIFGTNAVDFFGIIAILFTAMGVIGAVNSVNMADGVDGLLAALIASSLVCVIGLVAITQPSSLPISVAFVAVLLAAVVAFGVLNCRFMGLPRARVFLGDAGSTTIGFFFVYVLIAYSQGQSQIFSPVLAGWLLGMPLLDASAVILARVVKKKAPFYPDRTHLHHLLLDSGHGVNKTVAIIVGVHIGLIAFAVGLAAQFGQSADVFLFWGFVGLVLVNAVFKVLAGEPESEKGAAHSIPVMVGVPENKLAQAQIESEAVSTVRNGNA